MTIGLQYHCYDKAGLSGEERTIWSVVLKETLDRINKETVDNQAWSRHDKVGLVKWKTQYGVDDRGELLQAIYGHSKELK